ncbi:protein ImuA [Belnapia rosea]|uniref:Protein ImuA n=2 Tax=Belnapia rosea TaxID=938405 RepID=A0A1G6L1I5_9PROT|nr:protein ImuA [Belnapia rosea]SDC37054.1 protein ImuA [Belnapia rosea]
MDRLALRAALQARHARQGGAPQGDLSLCPEIDAALPGGGLPRAALHDVLGAESAPSAEFAALLLARAAGPVGGSVLWVTDGAAPMGLARFGLMPRELVLVRAERLADALWAMEEGLGGGVAGAVLQIADDPGPAALRRLQQAAGAGSALGLLLRADDAGSESGAVTRWRVGGGTAGLGDPRWRLELLRCRGGRPGQWDVVWRAAAEQLEVEESELEVLPVRHRGRVRQGCTMR